MKDDAKRTVQPGSSDHLLLTLARLETLAEESKSQQDQVAKRFENKWVQIHESINDVMAGQGRIMREVGILTANSKHNANQILELKSDFKQYTDHLHRVEKELDIVHATQRSCEARNFWHELQSAYNEDSKIIHVMKQKLDEKRNHMHTPAEGGLSVRISAGKMALSGPMKALILALLGLLLGAGATVATIISQGKPHTAQSHDGSKP